MSIGKQYCYVVRFWKSYNQFIKGNVTNKYNYPTLWNKIIACHRFTKLGWNKNIHTADAIINLLDKEVK